VPLDAQDRAYIAEQLRLNRSPGGAGFRLLDVWRATPKMVTKTVTFTGAAGFGAVGTVPIFTTTGEVLIDTLVPFCTTLLTEAAPTATIALGVVGSTSLLIAATNAVDIDASEFWVDTSPDVNGVVVPAALKGVAITDNIVATVAAQAVNSGVIRFDCYYRSLSPDGVLS
jgi:hypothetical protein